MMETLEQMEAKHAQALEKLRREHALAALAPVPPARVTITSGTLGHWITYKVSSLWEAIDLMRKFKPIPFYEFKRTFTRFVPVELNVGKDAGEEKSGPYVAKIKTSQGEGFGPSPEFCFFVKLGETICEIHCNFEGEHFARYGQYATRFGQYAAGFTAHANGPVKQLQGQRYISGSFRPNTNLAAMMDKTTKWGSGSDTGCSFSYAISADDAENPCGWLDAGLRLESLAEAMHGARNETGS